MTGIAGALKLAEQRKGIAALNLPPFANAKEMMLSYVRYARAHSGLFDLMIAVIERFSEWRSLIATRRPVSVAASATVKKSLGQGNMQ